MSLEARVTWHLYSPRHLSTHLDISRGASTWHLVTHCTIFVVSHTALAGSLRPCWLAVATGQQQAPS